MVEKAFLLRKNEIEELKLFFVELDVELRALCMLGKYSATFFFNF